MTNENQIPPFIIGLNEEKHKRELYTAKFNYYDFLYSNKEIWFKDITNKEQLIIKKDAYINRDDAIFLIGNLEYEEIIEFIAEISIDNQNKNVILNPKNIRKLENKYND